MKIITLVLLLLLDGLVVYVAARLQRRLLEATESSPGNLLKRARAYVSALLFASLIVCAAIFPFLANKALGALTPTRDTIGMLFIVGAAIVFVAGSLGLRLGKPR